jgi:rfaE bifunctional protein nucleotidyltransferase chain/domain
MTKYKIKSVEEIVKIAERLKSEGKIIVTTNGAFDLLHSGHVSMLERGKEKGDFLIVLVNSDASIREKKGANRPIIFEGERSKMLASLKCVDYVVVFDEDKPLSLFEKIRPSKHVRSKSFNEDRLKEEMDLFASWGGEYLSLPLEEGFSTTNVIERVLDAYKE